jgi:hypothetical protein
MKKLPLFSILLVLAGCQTPPPSGASLNGNQLVEQARKTLSGRSGYHMVATGQNADQLLQINADVLNSGSASGNFIYKGYTVQFIVVSGRAYLKGKEYFLAQSQTSRNSKLSAVGDRWVYLGETGALVDLEALINAVKLSDCFLNSNTNFVKKGLVKLEKGLTYEVDEKGAQGGVLSSIYIGADSPYYPWRIDSKVNHCSPSATLKPSVAPTASPVATETPSPSALPQIQSNTFEFSNFGYKQPILIPQNFIDLTAK